LHHIFFEEKAMNFSKSTLAAPIACLAFIAASILPAQALSRNEVIDMAVSGISGAAKKQATVTVAKWLKDCAMSDHCIRGQNISMITHRIPMDQVNVYAGECFDPWNWNTSSSVGRRMAAQISRQSGTPIIWSYYNNTRNGKGGEFVFGVPR
jgi:hypothetical protein